MQPKAPTALLLALAAAPLPLAGAAAQALPGDTVVVQWNEVTVQAIAATKPPPTAAARALAIVSTAIYDAWTAFDPVALPTQPGNGVGRAPAALQDPADKATALSYAAFQAEMNLFPSQSALITAQMAALGLDPTNTSLDPTTAAGIGNLAAAAVIAYRATDGSNQSGALSSSGAPYSDTNLVPGYTAYVPLNPPDVIASPTNVITNPNAWQPLQLVGAASAQKFATPFWGNVTPFTTLPTFQGQGPATTASWQYKSQTDVLLFYSATLNDTTKVIADYWADSPGTQLPPGHWSRIGEYVSRRDQHSVDADAQMFFALNNALMDAGIACWAVKRTYNSERPITSTHYLYTGRKIYAWAGIGKGSQWIDGSAWLPYQEPTVVTPPFSEYTSGHSTFSAAAATILQNFTNSDWFGATVTYAPGSTKIEPGIAPGRTTTLYFSTFSAAAAQAGVSRLYGGIHFWQGNLDGRFNGRQVGQLDWMQAQLYITAGASDGGNQGNNNNGHGYGHGYGHGGYNWPPQHYGAAWGAQPGIGWGQGWGGWGNDWGGSSN